MIVPEPHLSPHDALAAIASVATKRTALRARLEGITWVLWGLVVALQAMTLGFVQASGLAEGKNAHAVGLASHLWVLVGIVASLGIWRAAAVDLDQGLSRRRAMAFFVGLPLALHALAFVAGKLTDGAAAFPLVVAGLLALFAAFNPVRFTKRGQMTAAVLAAVAIVLASYLAATNATGPHALAVAGTLVGLGWIAAGLLSLYQG